MLQILWILFLVLLVFVLFLTQKGKDPYGTFHLALNKVHEDERHPQTEWLNMGYWKVRSLKDYTTTSVEALTHTSQNTSIFPEACQGLSV